jgi:hypothetical protein
MQTPVPLKKLPPLVVIRVTGAIRNFLISLGTRMFPAEFVMMEVASSPWLAKAVSVAAGLDIAGHLRDKPLHISELAQRSGAQQGALLRLMRLLSGNGIFRHCGDQYYTNTRRSRALLEEKHSMRNYFLHHLGEDTWAFLGDLEKCVMTGENAIKMQTGLEPFDYLAQHPRKNEVFSKAMTDTSEMAVPLIIKAFPFRKFIRIVDVGGGHGFLLAAIAARHPKVQGTLFDLPHVAPDAIRSFQRFGVEGRCRFTEGSFFTDEIPTGDLFLLKNILHDWDDEKCIAILKNIVKSMHPASRVLLIESLIDDKNRSCFSKTLDMQMLVGTTGGRERSREEFVSLFAAAGLELVRVMHTATPFYCIEGKIIP